MPDIGSEDPDIAPGVQTLLNELAAHHITVESQSKQHFFSSGNRPTLAHPSLVAFMTTEDRRQAPDGETRKLLHYLDQVLDAKAGQEAAVINFVAKLLEKLGCGII
ncbi:hypothetical protein DFS33DRAFT_1454756 [Desarmillaria ectypa]|nr:hypothetical protein DFS33DRAFT_1454756 [Desarmillaria ectypa]